MQVKDAAAKKSGKRYAFVDHYRAWAVVVMIETHAVNAWLSETGRAQPWFPFLNHINGLVAPSFLFISGVSFAILAAKKFDAISRPTQDFFHLLRRYGWIWVLGYLLHLPRIRWNGIRPSFVEEDLTAFYQADVLQAIALSLIVLLLLCLILRRRTLFFTGVSTLTLVALLATPLLWKVDFSSAMHPFFANYLNGLHNPLFPLFPWAVFAWAGALAGSWFLSCAGKDREAEGMIHLLGTGLALFVIGAVLREVRWIPVHNFWLDSPQWVMMRLGIVLGLFSLFWRLENRGITGWAPFLLVGTESLFAYVIHLVSIYWITGDKAGLPLLGYRTHGLQQTLLLYSALLISTILLTWLWKQWKLRRAASRKIA